MTKLRRLFNRSRPESQELNILRGILASIDKSVKASNEDAMFAKSNFKECHDGSGLHSCSIATPKHKTIDTRYLNLPPQELDSSNVYHNLSICPQTYQKNMDILRSKQSIGQYSGYSDHSYIDRTRYLQNKRREPYL